MVRRKVPPKRVYAYLTTTAAQAGEVPEPRDTNVQEAAPDYHDTLAFHDDNNGDDTRVDDQTSRQDQGAIPRDVVLRLPRTQRAAATGVRRSSRARRADPRVDQFLQRQSIGLGGTLQLSTKAIARITGKDEVPIERVAFTPDDSSLILDAQFFAPTLFDQPRDRRSAAIMQQAVEETTQTPDDSSSSTQNNEHQEEIGRTRNDFADGNCEPDSVVDLEDVSLFPIVGPITTNKRKTTDGIPPLPESTLGLFTMADKAPLRLWKLLDSKGAQSHYASVIKCFREMVLADEFNPQTSHIDPRERLIKKTTHLIPTPVANPVRLLSLRSGFMDGPIVSVPTFSMVHLLMDLLGDRTITYTLDNLVVNRDDPFLPYPNHPDKWDEGMDGLWYQRFIKEAKEKHGAICHDGSFNFYVPIILYQDKTGTTVYQRHGLEPVLFSSLILRRHIRRRDCGWRPLGYIPDLDNTSKADREMARGALNRANNQRNYHRCLTVITSEFKKATEWFLNNSVRLRIGQEQRRVRIVLGLAYGINDAKSGDMLCGFSDSSKSLPLSRLCQCHRNKNGTAAINFMQECIPTNGDDIKRKCLHFFAWKEREMERQETAGNTNFPEDVVDPNADVDERIRLEGKQAETELKDSCYAPMENAFSGLDLLGHKYGINGATPPDMMHTILSSGLLNYCLQMFFAQTTPESRLAIDKFVDTHIVSNRYTGRALYPRCNFSKGYSNLKEITAEEVAGKAFVWIILQAMPWSTEVLSMFQQKMMNIVFSRYTDDDDHSSDNESIGYGGDEEYDGQQNPWDGKSAVRETNAQDSFGESLPSHRRNKKRKHDEGKRRKEQKREGEGPPKVPCPPDVFAYVACRLLLFHSWYKDGWAYPI